MIVKELIAQSTFLAQDVERVRRLDRSAKYVVEHAVFKLTAVLTQQVLMHCHSLLWGSSFGTNERALPLPKSQRKHSTPQHPLPSNQQLSSSSPILPDDLWSRPLYDELFDCLLLCRRLCHNICTVHENYFTEHNEAIVVIELVRVVDHALYLLNKIERSHTADSAQAAKQHFHRYNIFGAYNDDNLLANDFSATNGPAGIINDMISREFWRYHFECSSCVPWSSFVSAFIEEYGEHACSEYALERLQEALIPDYQVTNNPLPTHPPLCPPHYVSSYVLCQRFLCLALLCPALFLSSPASALSFPCPDLPCPPLPCSEPRRPRSWWT